LLNATSAAGTLPLGMQEAPSGQPAPWSRRTRHYHIIRQRIKLILCSRALEDDAAAQDQVPYEVVRFGERGRMTPEELKVKIDEVRTLIVEKLAELEEDPKWGSEEEREELADALEELSDHAAVMRDTLREEE